MTAIVNGASRCDYENGKTLPSLAKDCETIDETHYRITLRDDAKYADGTPVKAADVEYTIRVSHENGVESVVHVVPEECKAEDDTHYVIAFDEYVPGWQAGLSETNMTIFSDDQHKTQHESFISRYRLVPKDKKK